jgi:hypothetical protein
VTQRNWRRIVRGDRLTLRGRGYYYDGQFNWDFWHFAGGIAGELRVSHGSPKDRDYSGEGYVGRARDVLIAVRPA